MAMLIFLSVSRGGKCWSRRKSTTQLCALYKRMWKKRKKFRQNVLITIYLRLIIPKWCSVVVHRTWLTQGGDLLYQAWNCLYVAYFSRSWLPSWYTCPWTCGVRGRCYLACCSGPSEISPGPLWTYYLCWLDTWYVGGHGLILRILYPTHLYMGCWDTERTSWHTGQCLGKPQQRLDHCMTHGGWELYCCIFIGMWRWYPGHLYCIEDRNSPIKNFL